MSYAAIRASRSTRSTSNKVALTKAASILATAKKVFTLRSPAGNDVHYCIFKDTTLVVTIKSGYWNSVTASRSDWTNRIDQGYKRVA